MEYQSFAFKYHSDVFWRLRFKYQRIFRTKNGSPLIKKWNIHFWQYWCYPNTSTKVNHDQPIYLWSKKIVVRSSYSSNIVFVSLSTRCWEYLVNNNIQCLHQSHYPRNIKRNKVEYYLIGIFFGLKSSLCKLSGSR